MSARREIKRGQPVVRITRGGDIYRVELGDEDFFFLSERERQALDSLRNGERLRVRDMGRAFMLWKHGRGVMAYEKIIK